MLTVIFSVIVGFFLGVIITPCAGALLVRYLFTHQPQWFMNLIRTKVTPIIGKVFVGTTKR